MTAIIGESSMGGCESEKKRLFGEKLSSLKQTALHMSLFIQIFDKRYTYRVSDLNDDDEDLIK